MSLDPWRLRLLDAFARVGTVRGVAAELRLSPSSVSQQLALLESEAGAAIFERSGRSLHLTPIGATLAVRAGELRDHLDAIEAEVLEATSGPAGHLRIGGFASSIEPLLVPAVHQLELSHPRLTVELLEIEPHESVTALHQGRCEIVVTVDEEDGALLSPAVTVIPLATDPLLIVAPVGHRVAAMSAVPLAELAGERWALDMPGTYLGELVPRHCRLAGFEPVVAGRFSSYSIMLAHVAAGLSVAVLPELAAPDVPGVIRRPTVGFADRKIVAAVRRASARRPAVRSAVEVLRGR